jgi:hypothetical protein
VIQQTNSPVHLKSSRQETHVRSEFSADEVIIHSQIETRIVERNCSTQRSTADLQSSYWHFSLPDASQMSFETTENKYSTVVKFVFMRIQRCKAPYYQQSPHMFISQERLSYTLFRVFKRSVVIHSFSRTWNM